MSDPCLDFSLARKMEDLLAAGHHPQAVLDLLVEDILVDVMLASESAIKVVLHLAGMGAKAATTKPDCALARICTKSIRPRPALIIDLARQLATIPGELPFHTLAANLILYASDYQSLPHVRASLCARDEQGRTVAHHIWADHGALANAAAASRNAKPGSREEDDLAKSWLSTLKLAWEQQYQIHQLGMSLDAVDQDGTTVASLVRRRIEQGDALLLASHPMCKIARAFLDGHAMDQATPPPPAPAPPAPRF